MAEHRIETQILLRYDTYNQWMSIDPILQMGETAVTVFPNNIEGLPPKAIGIKIGDGVHYFSELPWIQGLAADVYNWAKTSTKPTYSATEITGLAEYIAAHTSGGGGGSGSTSGAYQIVWDDASSKYILQIWNDTTQEWENTASEIDFSDILIRIDTIERWANGDKNNLGNIYDPITAIVYDQVVTYLNTLDTDDRAVEHQFVTQVTQNDGKIRVTRSILKASDISEGVIPTSHGGTGLSTVNEDQILVGSEQGNIVAKTFVTEIDTTNRNTFATVGAIIDYIALMTAGLTGAMHFIGESTVAINPDGNSRVNPQISGYNFNNARPGDVILANNAQEFVWTGNNWRLLGDEGSYAVKGSIVNADIAENAAIAQYKIDGLTEALDNKVDKEEGKTLLSAEDKEKLDAIEEGAQVNLIEHIVLNDVEVSPNAEKTITLTIPILTQEQLDAIDNAQANVIEHIFVNGIESNPMEINKLPKSVAINFIPFTQEEKDKLFGIYPGAQVNTVESIIINNTEYTPNNNKQVEITIDQAALNLQVLEGARYPTGGNNYTDIEITNKKLELSKVAATGDIDDLVQTSAYVIFNCGSSTEVI